ncbi:DNA topoisomerase [Pseudopedobacter saltans DSM 12145]|uniref:DNA topoisomerase n=1 Tax=Pseudopedobacter saltans (strain ATCC 51119 / DSM 12145 / JCM 21818 / CCUG 39354 / LMG 10337 / NBRC 100064 / NCIMB 13643) TaxID=762903 RepID=F0S8P9_PSESL|nr:DNA topoisomerase IB [Pseudopedobacter saltans]ADY52380.1 DNA topoisomerase [Pseudopedobacter saltans DSM 12145]
MNRLQQKLEKIGTDAKSTAKSVGLRYIDNFNKGYKRLKKEYSFYYTDTEGKVVKDKELLERFKKLVIPPAYEDVWISPAENTHLLFTGIDAKGRKQYRYHPEWNQIRNQAKFYRLKRFANALPNIRKRIEQDLKRKGLPLEKVLALVVKLMELTNIRIGNESYSKLYGSFGLTTLKDRHVKFNGNKEVKFSFKGKKGIYHEISLQDRSIAKLIKNCQDIPGKELFQYYDEDGNHHSIDSGDVNSYIKEISGEDFTAKDFRTWFGSVHAICAFRDMGSWEKQTELKSNIVQAIDYVAQKLGNTRTVCKKYYVHPTVISSYENGRIHLYKTRNTSSGCFTDYEKLLIKILDKEDIG